MNLLKVEAAAELLKVTPETVYRWARRGILPVVKLGRVLRINRSELERLIDGHTIEEDAPKANGEFQEK